MSVDAINADKMKISAPGLTPSFNTASATTSQSEAISDSEVQSAVTLLSSHLSAQTTEPRMSVDYLSGLNVVTFTAKETGAVIYQMPSVDAVRLARLIGEGGDIKSLGLLEKTV